MKLKRYRLVFGQHLHPDAPRTCAFCGQPYRRRHLLLLHERRQRGADGPYVTVPQTIRICADEGTGCFQNGLWKLFKGRTKS